MSLAQLFTAIFFLLLGITWLGWVSISVQFLGGLAAVTSLLWLVEGYKPIVIYRRS